MNRRKPTFFIYLTPLLYILSATAWLSGCKDTAYVFDRWMVGEMHVDPEIALAIGNLELEVLIRVRSSEAVYAEPVEGVRIELVSSRNQGSNIVDFIMQPDSPTDSYGVAIAYLGSSTTGETMISVLANGAVLCETWDDGKCIPLQRLILFGINCGGSGQTECDSECVDLQSDPSHCGACNNACELENASSSCVDSTCVVAECDIDWGNCDDDNSNGCESDLPNDPNNCGFCGNKCPSPYLCSFSSCVDIGCDACDLDCDSFLDERCGGDDCDDYDATVFPWAPEICDGKDNDCNDEIDENPDACDDDNECTDDVCERGQGCVNILMAGISCDDGNDCSENDVCQLTGSCAGTLIDEDGDGHGVPPCGEDCDDTNSHVNPSIFEGGPRDSSICEDGLDNDCDGHTDGEDPTCCSCSDDAYCDNGNPCDGVEWCVDCVCMPGTPVACDDGEECTSDTCDPVEGSCSHSPVPDGTACDDGNECTTDDFCTDGGCWPGDPLDSDEDGYPAEQCGGSDCDDGDPAINPGVIEGPQGSPICSDGVDNDCDTSTDDSDPGCNP